MTEAPTGAQEPSGASASKRVLVYAVSVTLLTQVLASAALVAQSVIVPVAAPDLGVQAQSIGVLVSLVYLIAVIAGLVAPAFVRRFGPLRVCTFSFVQVIVITYCVSYLHLEIGLSLVAAGLAFSSAQAASVLGRIGWGVLADRWLSAPRVLGIVGITVSVLLVVMASIAGTWPIAAIVIVVTLVGLTGLGWNGVHFAEVARRAPQGEVATSASGIQFFSFGGALLAPIVFGTLVSLTGTYATGFSLLALAPLWVGLRFLLSRT
jgi:cyanate permease